MFLAEQFTSSLIKIHGQHPVSADGGVSIHRLVGS